MVILFIVLIGAVIVALGIVLAPVILPLLAWLLGIGAVLLLLGVAYGAAEIGYEKMSEGVARLLTPSSPRTGPPFWNPDRRYRLRVALVLSALGVLVIAALMLREFEPS